MWGARAVFVCPLPVLLCGPPPLPSFNNQLMVGLGGLGPAQGGPSPSEGPVCAAAFLAALANTLLSTRNPVKSSGWL